MPHDTPLIATIVIGLTLAFVFGAAVNRLRISPIVGYLLAGVAVGPYTPGFIADQGLANELAEIGVILLMFGVGLHFSLKDLLSVRAIAIPGAIAQILVATLLGMGLAYGLGWNLGGGIVFGLALSVASTVVLLRALQERRLVSTERGRIAVGWLIVEDIVMVLALVLLPALLPLLDGRVQQAAAGTSYGFDLWDLATAIGITLAKVAAFFVVMLVAGRRMIPWILHQTAHTGSRELFRLAVLSIALGVAYASANVFGVSLALGAFFAGMILNESELSQQAAAESLPFRDAFAVLFFISVGMLFNPAILINDAWPVIATLLIIVIGKSAAAFLIVLAFRYPLVTALTISASLAQIGEFSFILAALGVSTGLLPERGRDLILAGAILSIFINPLFFVILDRLKPWLDQKEISAGTPGPVAVAEQTAVAPTKLKGHVVLVGYGRVGSLVGEELLKQPSPLLVIEEMDAIAENLKARGIEVLAGHAALLIDAANLAAAKALVVVVPNGFEAGQIVEKARKANAGLIIIAGAQTEAEAEHIRRFGANGVIVGNREIADAITAQLKGVI